ncbi:hypothetical protein Ade02nite_47090 [Paractinoplanes deccanensis]|uniref:CHAT domain-containing protein n=1 Tax=Paractinoplanes deccanensis TaxID=113561 RepID=A0ABQ3Y7V7_9ACTN|nr:CHAT domain-containing protein [Actinoplanes deccanensis]GID76068.1 hypothetical protein Ade02nite_47090 [Actinoplanes deccanensis]
MPGTAVELVPGGLLDRLAATAEADALSAVRAAAAAGAPARALAATGGVTGADPVTLAAWRHFAWHAYWLALPDGGGAPQTEALLGRMLREAPRPRPEVIARPEDWIVGRLLTEVREWRAIATQAVLLDDSDAVRGLGIADIDEARARLGTRQDLQGHLDLLAADLSARTGDLAAADGYLRSARQRLDAAGDARGLAAASLVTGDLLAAPLSSPLAWNCLLVSMRSTPGAELDDKVELREFTGSPGAADAARAAYDDSEARYAAAGDAAGLAAAGLRRAYLEVAAGRPAEAVALATRARQSFAEAGRPLDEATAAVHAALAAVADDVLPADAGAAALVIAAGAATIGHGPALGLGLLCCRMGRHWSALGDRPERGVAALGLARQVLAATGDPVLRSQAAAAAGEAAAAVNDVTAVRLAIRDALAADDEPLAEPADPLDHRRQRRALLAVKSYILGARIRDVDGMERAARALEDVLEPLRRGLDGYTGTAQQVAAQLLTLTDLPGNAVTGLVYRARAARDAGDDELEEELLTEALEALDAAPGPERDFGEAVVTAYTGDLAAASAAFERYAEGELAGTAEGSPAWRMIHVEGLAFQLNVERAGPARAHHDALSRSRPDWWRGLGEKWEHRTLVARLLEQEGDLPGALAVFDEALGDIERTRGGLRRDELKTSFFAGSGVRNAYLDATRVALRLAEAAPAESAGWHAKAFGYAERARSRALRDLLAANLSAEGAGLSSALVDRWRAAGAQVTLAQDRLAAAAEPSDELRAALAAALSTLDAVELELRDADPRFWTAVNPQAVPAGLGTVAAGLPEGVAIIQYVAGAGDLLAWAVTRHGLTAPHRRRDREVVRLTGLVSTMVDACATGRRYTTAAAGLADLLLEPLRPVIERSSALLLIPSGPLARLPFGALPWDGAPLWSARPLTVLPSAGLPEARPPGAAGGPSLVVGDPSDMAYQFPGSPRPAPQPALPGAAVEAWHVSRTLAGATLLLGPQATEAAVRAGLSGAPVIHLATHGVLDPEAPLGTAVLLASGESLTAAELFGVRLDAGLVVMSACRTGAGTVVGGDELLGLGRALVAAGARAVLVSRWAIDDTSTALLMAEFHRRRAAGSSDAVALQEAVAHIRSLDRKRARALFDRMTAEAAAAGQQAVAALTEQAVRDLDLGPDAPYEHPYHWAAFDLISAGG